jgi:hypothetical protein
MLSGGTNPLFYAAYFTDSGKESALLIVPVAIQSQHAAYKSPRHNEKCLQYSYYWRLHTAANVWSHTIPLAASHQPPTTEARSNFRPVHIRFVVDKAALGQDPPPRGLQFSYQYHSIHALYFHIHLSPTLNILPMTASINNTPEMKKTQSGHLVCGFLG